MWHWKSSTGVQPVAQVMGRRVDPPVCCYCQCKVFPPKRFLCGGHDTPLQTKGNSVFGPRGTPERGEDLHPLPRLSFLSGTPRSLITGLHELRGKEEIHYGADWRIALLYTSPASWVPKEKSLICRQNEALGQMPGLLLRCWFSVSFSLQ